MDLDPIGKHCALQSCNILDLLPIQCSCLEWFCRLHVPLEAHQCSSLQQRHLSTPSASASTLPKCAFLKCNKLSLATVAADAALILWREAQGIAPGRCPGCQLGFCVDHRHMQSHSCAGLSVDKDDVKHEAARAILSQKFLATSTPTSHTPVVARRQRKPPTDPQKLAQLKRVDLMKLRHKAVPANINDRNSMVPVEQRLHVIVRLEMTNQLARETTLWFRKTTTTGKALDLILQHFCVSHTTSTLHLEKSSPEIESHVLQNHLELSEQLEDGSTVVLSDSTVN